MPRLLIHVEGQTEETFVNELLAPHLSSYGVAPVGARLLGNARQRDRRGGIRGWVEARRDIVNHLKEDVSCAATLMVDYYGLPRTGSGAWPGRDAATAASFDQRASTVQNALLADICTAMGAGFDAGRFVPFVLMHEFEGLLFSDCSRFANAIGRPELAASFQAIRNQFATPEEINDSPQTAPSKRVQKLVPGYEKPLYGVLAAIEVGLDLIRAECPIFAAWLQKLEELT